MKIKQIVVVALLSLFVGAPFASADEQSDKVREIIEMLRKRQAEKSGSPAPSPSTTERPAIPSDPVAANNAEPETNRESASPEAVSGVSTTPFPRPEVAIPSVIPPQSDGTPANPIVPTITPVVPSITPVVPSITPVAPSSPPLVPTIPTVGIRPAIQDMAKPIYPAGKPSRNTSATGSAATGASLRQDLPIAQTIPITRAPEKRSVSPRTSRVNIPVIGKSQQPTISGSTGSRYVTNTSGDSFTAAEIDNIQRRLEAALTKAKMRLPRRQSYNPIPQSPRSAPAPVPSARMATTYPVPQTPKRSTLPTSRTSSPITRTTLPKSRTTLPVARTTPQKSRTSRPITRTTLPSVSQKRSAPPIAKTYPVTSQTSKRRPPIRSTVPTPVTSTAGKPPIRIAQTYPMPTSSSAGSSAAAPSAVSGTNNTGSSDSSKSIGVEPKRISEPTNPDPGIDRDALKKLFVDSRNQATLVGSAGSDVTWTDAEWAKAKPSAWRYNGEWQNGTMHGKGRLSYKDGWDYFGNWKDGKMHGQGHLTFPDGTVYQGDFIYNLPHGDGTITYSDGAKFIGQWADGEISGTGALLNPGT